jgi:DNA-binding NarL/FixJ family response regulator
MALAPPPRIPVIVGRFEDLAALGLHALLGSDPALEVVASDVAPDRLETVIAEHLPRVALINFGTLRSPVEVHDLHVRHPECRTIVLANRPSPVECQQLIAFGAAACLSKETQGRDILNAVHLASRGLHVLPRPGEGAAGPELLTAREADVLELLQAGRSNGEIAVALHVGVETVRTHVRNIFRKLGVSSRRELSAGARPRYVAR